MSELRVDSIKSKGGGAPNLPKGVTISGIATAATLGVTNVDGTNVNVSGVVTSGTLNGELLSTGTPTLGLGVTINSSGVVISGVATAGIVSATTLYGDGSNITGVGVSIAPLFYNPDTSDQVVTVTTGIGITFNQQIRAGSGNITLRKTSASGTVVENFGVGSSVTISENKVSFSPTSNLEGETVYHINYPSGCFTNNLGESYAGTAYTFSSLTGEAKLFVWGNNNDGSTNARGQLGLNQGNLRLSSPVQLPGSWKQLQGNYAEGYDNFMMGFINTSNELWVTGANTYGVLGTNQSHPTKVSSPVQVPGTTWSFLDVGENNVIATKTDGTLWSWGYNTNGPIGDNTTVNKSSPVQVGSATDWNTTAGRISSGNRASFAIKTNGQLWAWGNGHLGNLGINIGGGGVTAFRSSPCQVPGTTWNGISGGFYWTVGTKTDGTMWSWDQGGQGQLGHNSITSPSDHGVSSPIQIPGTTWKTGYGDWAQSIYGVAAIKTDGTLWAWGMNSNGQLGQNGPVNTQYSSPVQIGSDATWNKITAGNLYYIANKTDGTLWSWGNNVRGELGQNNLVKYSSPTQIGSRTDWTSTQLSAVNWSVYAMMEDLTG